MSPIEAFFSRPGNVCEIEDKMVQDINGAKSKVLMAAAFTKNTSKIIQAINKKRDIHVKIVVNTNGFTPTFNTDYVGEMKLNDGCMHNKFIIIDNSILWTGSFNMTLYAAQANFENALRITEPHIIESYILEFHRMYFFANAIEKVHIELSKDNKRITTKCEKCKNIIGDAGKDFNIEVNYFHEYEHASANNSGYHFDERIDDRNIGKQITDYKGKQVKLTKGLFISNLVDDAKELGVTTKYVCYCINCKTNNGSKKKCDICKGHYSESDIIEVNEFDKVKYYSKLNSNIDIIEDYRLSHQHPDFSKGLYNNKVCLKCIDEIIYKTF